MKSPILLTVLAIVAITVVSGLVQGKLSGRWGPSPDLIAAGKSIDTFPREFGDWKMSSESEMGEEIRDELQCTGSVSRSYINQQTGQVVRVAMIVGPPGPTAVHVPEICYSSQAYTQEGERERVHVQAADGSRDGDFWALTFRSNDLNGSPLRVYYAWSDGHRWQAVENPRVSLSGEKVLYKIQLASDIREGLSGGREWWVESVQQFCSVVIGGTRIAWHQPLAVGEPNALASGFIVDLDTRSGIESVRADQEITVDW